MCSKRERQPPNGSSPPKLGGVVRRRFISRAGVVPKENHPVCAPLLRLRDIFLMGAATPAKLGGALPFGGFATFGNAYEGTIRSALAIFSTVFNLCISSALKVTPNSCSMVTMMLI